jgi:AcrR family transcriptional regulator
MPRTKEQNIAIRQKTRAKIINSSMKLFGQNGFDRTSVNAIAKEAQISKGLIYNHFETKEDIVKGIVDMLMEIGEKMVIPNVSFESPQHHLKHIIDNFFQLISQESEMLRWMLPMSFQIERFPFVTEVMARKTKGIIAITQNLFSEIGYEDPDQEAWFFGAIFDGISMDQLLVPNYDLQKMNSYILSKYKLENL